MTMIAAALGRSEEGDAQLVTVDEAFDPAAAEHPSWKGKPGRDRPPTPSPCAKRARARAGSPIRPQRPIGRWPRSPGGSRSWTGVSATCCSRAAATRRTKSTSRALFHSAGLSPLTCGVVAPIDPVWGRAAGVAAWRIERRRAAPPHQR